MQNGQKQRLIDKDRLFAETDYEPHVGQQAVHDSQARFRVVIAGRRWGKSLSAAKEAEAMLMEPNTRGWVVSTEYELTRKVLREIEKDFIRKKKMNPTKRQMSGPLMLEFPWGSSVEGKSADNVTSLLGEGLDWLIFDEAAQCKSVVWEQYLRPTLTDREGWALFITTPKGYNWVYDLYKRGKDENHPDWESFQSPSWENPHLSKNDIEEARNTLPDTAFRQEYGAEFTVSAGQVYSEFQEKTHVIPARKVKTMIQEGWPRYRAIDFGYNNPTVILWITVDPMDRVIIYDEYYMSHRTIQETAHFMVKRVTKRNDVEAEIAKLGRFSPLVKNKYVPRCDTKDTQYEFTVCDVSAKAQRMELLEEGIPCFGYSSDVRHGLELVRQQLKMRPGGEGDMPGLIVSSKCVNTIKEFNLYAYPDGEPKADEKPTKTWDHACFVSGTKIITDTGDRSIEDIEQGDMVLTRSGFKRVLCAGSTGKRNVVRASFTDGKVLTATPDHPIIINNQHIPLRSLRYSDIIYTITDLFHSQSEQGDVLCQKLDGSRKLNLTGLSIADTRMPIPIVPGCILPQTDHIERPGWGGFIRKFGSTLTEKSRRAAISIISTLTQIITNYPICNVLQPNYTTSYMQNEFAELASPCLRLPSKLRSVGISPQKAASFIARLVRCLGITPNTDATPAVTVGQISNLAVADNLLSSAAITASLPTEESLGKTVNHESVPFAEIVFLQTSTLRREPARVLAVDELPAKQRVYNLEVEDEHEYFANGILVSNCDAIRYFVVAWRRGPAQSYMPTRN